MVISQGQFFDPDEYNIDPRHLNFDQFTRTADYFHGTYSSDPDYFPTARDRSTWGDTHPAGYRFRDLSRYADSYRYMHAGTQQAAAERITAQSGKAEGGSGLIFPLRHVGKLRSDVQRDQNVEWGTAKHHVGTTGETVPYVNETEDPGSVSVLGLSNRFQTYKEYVESIPKRKRTERQQLELEHGREAVPFGQAEAASNYNYFQKALTGRVGGGLENLTHWYKAGGSTPEMETERKRADREARESKVKATHRQYGPPSKVLGRAPQSLGNDLYE